MTKWQIINAFLNGHSLPLTKNFGEQVGPQKALVVVNRIEREDGSNHSYNVTGINLQKQEETVHIRTQD